MAWDTRQLFCAGWLKSPLPEDMLNNHESKNRRFVHAFFFNIVKQIRALAWLVASHQLMRPLNFHSTCIKLLIARGLTSVLVQTNVFLGPYSARLLFRFIKKKATRQNKVADMTTNMHDTQQRDTTPSLARGKKKNSSPRAGRMTNKEEEKGRQREGTNGNSNIRPARKHWAR